MKRLHYSAVAGLLLAGALGAAAYVSLGSASPAPVVAYTLVDGSKASTAQFDGKVVLVNFWATSCASCVKEMPHLASTYDKFRARGYDTLAVAMSYDPPAFVANFVERRKLPFPVALDGDGSVALSFGDVRLTPTSVLINKRGEIVKRYLGEPDFVALHQLIEELLAET